MDRTRRLRRAQAWRWEPPGASAATGSDSARQHWAEARAKSIAWAAAVADDPRAVYLDTETTGFGPRAEIVDIAIVNASGEILLESLVRPTRRIPREVIAIHGITDADVTDAPDWAELHEQVCAVLAGRRVIVYNVTFDRQMVTQSCGNYALPEPDAEWECAMRRYAGYHGNWDSRKRWYSFVKLEKAVRTFGAEPGGHRAAADALACRTVVLGMAATPLPNPDDVATLPAAPAHLATADSMPWQGAEAASGRPGDGAIELARWMRACRWFRATLDATPSALRDRPGACGSWSPREVAAHCAGWEWEAARRLRLVAADGATADAPYDVDQFNFASVAVRARQGWPETLSELDTASAALARAAAAVPDDPRTVQWLRGRAADFEAHAVGLRRWLDEATSPLIHDRGRRLT